MILANAYAHSISRIYAIQFFVGVSCMLVPNHFISSLLIEKEFLQKANF